MVLNMVERITFDSTFIRYNVNLGKNDRMYFNFNFLK